MPLHFDAVLRDVGRTAKDGKAKLRARAVEAGTTVKANPLPAHPVTAKK